MSPPSASTYSCSVKRSCALTSLSRIGRFRLSTPPPIDPVERHARVEQRGLVLARRRADHELVALQQRDDQRPRVHESAPALDDQLEDAPELHLASDRLGDVRRRAHPAHGLLELLGPLSLAVVEPGVLDRDAGPCREEDRRLLVRLRERAVVLLGEVQVPPGLASNQDRHAEERRHRRMPWREPVGARVASDVGETQRLRVLDQDAEDASTAGEVADLVAGLVIDPPRDEPLELLTVLVQHTERGIPGAGQLARDCEHALQQRFEVQLGDDVRHGLHQPPESGVLEIR